MQIQRVLPAWHSADLEAPHIFGDVAVTFDTEGFADVTDPAVQAIMLQFPETFHVVDQPETQPPSTRAEAPREASQAARHTQCDLEQLTVYQLQDMAARLRISSARTMRKQELIEAILTAEAL